MDKRFEVTSTKQGENGQAVVFITRNDWTGVSSGSVTLDQRGKVLQVSTEAGAGLDSGWPTSIDGELELTALIAARETKLILPVPHPEREITSKPRIITLQDGKDEDANGEGCLVVVDDPAAVTATGKYGGPKEAPPNRDFIRDLAGLPGRKYLVVTDQAGKPIPPPRSLDGRIAVFHGKNGDNEVLALSSDFSTVYRSWQDAEDAIRTARERGLLK